MRVGFIARADNGGLGVESLEFYQHIDCKVLVVRPNNKKIYPGRFKNAKIVGVPTDEELVEFLEDIDILFCIETPYNWNAFKIAKRMGVKTVLRINYEWLDKPIPVMPDLIISPSLWNFDKIPDPKVYIPFPVNRKLLPFELRKKANIFVHNAGNMNAAYDRNGTQILLKAIPLVKSNVRFVIKSQVPIENIKDKRVIVIVKDYDNYWEIWQGKGDVYVYPRRYAGQSLVMNEAMSRGLAVMMTDMSPQNEFLAEELLIKPTTIRDIFIKRNIEIADILSEMVARKIDEIAGQDITKYSKLSDHIAEAWSWKSLKPKLLKTFEYVSRNL